MFTSVLMADELNRTPPRTQSALLECMAERRVTVDRETHALPDPFFVIATQNPLTAAGTYMLPDNQLDRFLLRIQIGHLEPEFEVEVVSREDGHRLADDVRPVASAAELKVARAAIDQVAREQVGGALDPLEGQLKRQRQRASEQGLTDPREVFNQQVPTR